jgi:hypothetical protein
MRAKQSAAELFLATSRLEFRTMLSFDPYKLGSNVPRKDASEDVGKMSSFIVLQNQVMA